MLKAIIFDFDGVLVESVDIKAQAFGALYEAEGPEIQQSVVDYHNRNGGISRFEKIRHYEEKLLGRSVSDEDVRILADRFGDIVERKVAQSPWVAGAEEFLKTYSDRIPLFVASATPQEELRRITAQRGMDRYFKAVLGTPVKKAEHIAAIIKDYNFGRNEIVMIGDAMTDYDAARTNGISFLGRVPPDSKSPFPAGTRIVADLTGLDQALGLS